MNIPESLPPYTEATLQFMVMSQDGELLQYTCGIELSHRWLDLIRITAKQKGHTVEQMLDAMVDAYVFRPARPKKIGSGSRLGFAKLVG